VEFQDKIVNAIRRVMPTTANLSVEGGIDSFRVGISWRLNDDPERQNKMSKTISLVISEEAAQDFASASVQNQDKAYNRINHFLSQKLANFYPSHNVPRFNTPPVEEWVINSHVLFG